MLGYTEENSTSDIAKTVPCESSLPPPPQTSSHCLTVEEMVGCPAGPVESTSELIPQLNPTPHHSEEHTDLFTSLLNEHHLDDLIDPYSFNSPATELDQDWNFDWSSLLNDAFNVTGPVCY